MSDTDGLDFGDNGFPIQPAFPAHAAAGEWIFSSVQFAIAGAVVVLAIHFAYRFRSPWPLMCVLGGFLTGFIEPVVDVGLQVFWTGHVQPTYISGFGRHVPIMTLAVYTYLMGFSAMMIWLWTHKGTITRKKVLVLYVGMIAGINVLEPVGIAAQHMWFYGGQQGLRFFEYPVWYSVSIASIFVMNGAIQYRAKPYLHGWRVVGVVVLVPMVDVGLFYATGWPMFLALNNEPAMAVTYLCNAWAIAQGFLVVYLALALIGLVEPHKPSLHHTGAEGSELIGARP